MGNQQNLENNRYQNFNNNGETNSYFSSGYSSNMIPSSYMSDPGTRYSQNSFGESMPSSYYNSGYSNQNPSSYLSNQGMSYSSQRNSFNNNNFNNSNNFENRYDNFNNSNNSFKQLNRYYDNGP